LQCIIGRLSINDHCPYPKCGAKVANAELLVTDCENELEQLYPSGNVTHQDCFPEEEVIKVVMLTGDFEMFSYDSSTTVESLKLKIADRFKVNSANQQLMYEEFTLQVTASTSMRSVKDTHKLTSFL